MHIKDGTSNFCVLTIIIVHVVQIYSSRLPALPCAAYPCTGTFPVQVGDEPGQIPCQFWNAEYGDLLSYLMVTSHRWG